MDKVNLINYLQKCIDELYAPYEKSDGYDGVKAIVSKYKLKTVKDFVDADVYDVFKCIYYVDNKEFYTFDEVSKKIDSYKKFTTLMNDKSIDVFQSILKKLYTTDMIDIFIEFIIDKNPIKCKFDLLRLNSRFSPDVVSILEKIKEQYQGFIPELISLLKMVEHNDGIVDLFEYVKLHDHLSLDSKTYESVATIIKKSGIRKSAIKPIEDVFDDKYDFDGFMSDLENIHEFILDEEKKDAEFRKSNSKELYSIKKAKEAIEMSKDGEEIVNARELVKGIKNLKVKYEILSFVQENNNKYYSELDSRIAMFNEDTKLQYQVLLNEFGISSDKYDVDSIMNNSLDDVRSILSILTKYELDYMKRLYILNVSNLDKVNTIVEYFKKNFLSSNYVFNNIEMFAIESDKLDKFIDSVKFLDDREINPKLFINYNDYMINNSDIFKNNIECLIRYDLVKYLKNACNLNFLLCDNLCDKIDTFIELGYEKYLLEDLGLLTINDLKRLFVLKELNVPIESKDDLYKYLTSKRFFVPEDSIDLYIPICSKVDSNANIRIEDFEKNRVSTRTYCIDGEYISADRVKRNLNNGLCLYDSIFNGIHIDEEGSKKISDYLEGCFKK